MRIPRSPLIVAFAVAWLGACHESFAQMARLGNIAERLTDQDLRSINRLVAENQSSPFLLSASRSHVLPETWYLDAFFLPESDRAQVRRGRVLKVSTVLRDEKPTEWRVEGSARYAQVGVAGRPFPRAFKPEDVDRPFLVEGEFTDSELASIVSFIRSSPSREIKSDRNGSFSIRGGATDVEGTWPIGTVRRTTEGDSMVILSRSEGYGQTVILRFVRGRWTIVEVGFWIV